MSLEGISLDNTSKTSSKDLTNEIDYQGKTFILLYNYAIEETKKFFNSTKLSSILAGSTGKRFNIPLSDKNNSMRNRSHHENLHVHH